MFAGIEAGGTKFVCAVGTSPSDLHDVTRIPTTSPEETLTAVAAFLRPCYERAELQGIGVGSFGPVDLLPSSLTYGFVTSTPKPRWVNTDLVGYLQRSFNVPIGFDTDVNAAALAEYRWGAARGLDPSVYLTIGTGIGGGGIVNGKLMHGLMHPEMGHILMPRVFGDEVASVCPFHDSCLEGLASGPAMEKRWGMVPTDLPPEHPGWELEASYLACAVATYICVLSPHCIVMGGGVMQRDGLLAMIRKKARALLNNYLRTPEIADGRLERLIVAPGLGDRSGILGAIALAELATGSGGRG